jgi:hypothetical protein
MIPTIARLRAARPAAVLVLAVAGCAGRSPGLDAAIADYEAGRFDEARAGALESSSRSQGTARDSALYLAGVSAYRLGDVEDAEQHLIAAARSSDDELAAQAQAMIGLVDLARDRPLIAASAFDAAAPDLAEADADAARRKAAEARAAAGAAARIAVAARDGDRGPFALQIGAFAEVTRAKRAADEVERAARSAGLGAVRVAPHADGRGRRLYYVQVGRFATKDDAVRARASMRRHDLIVTAVRD